MKVIGKENTLQVQVGETGNDNCGKCNWKEIFNVKSNDGKIR